VQITIESGKTTLQAVADAYLFPTPDIYTVTAQFRGMSDNYTVMVGNPSDGTNNGNGGGSGDGQGGGGGISFIWKK
jgi:hypothetical protein